MVNNKIESGYPFSQGGEPEIRDDDRGNFLLELAKVGYFRTNEAHTTELGRKMRQILESKD